MEGVRWSVKRWHISKEMKKAREPQGFRESGVG